MGDKMRPIPFGKLMDWVLEEYSQKGSFFGVKKLYIHPEKECFEIFGEKLEIPFGPAAGPHTQLAQNIVASYASGSRFFELKTVQVLDGEDLPVSKPCILVPDEGYNVEWSTELRVPEAMDEYIKGWFALKLLSKELGLGISDGFVFNMSVGYDLDGIKTEKIDAFIEGLKNAENTEQWKTCKAWALENLFRFKQIDKDFIEGISPNVCSSITLSTLHGCPPEEIERIAAYLLSEKKLHTFVKCNPTLLGYDFARKTMDDLGFDYLRFDDHHFKADLQFDDAVPMLRRLQALGNELSLNFGVKLTNTFPVQIARKELPGKEMYMSGRALFPLTIEVANRLTKAFDGKLRISFSGGAEFHNIDKIYNTGIWPITLATTLLKPGGYERLKQLADKLVDCGYKPFERISTEKLQELAAESLKNPLYRKLDARATDRKIKGKAPLIDCFTAPCRAGCPLSQDIPAYLRLAGEGKFLDAFNVITERNPLPFITGTLCPHHCTDKCTRDFYEGCIDIRKVKLEAAEGAYAAVTPETRTQSHICVPKPASKSGKQVAIIGGGPAGLAAAYFLSRAGLDVTIFEKRGSLGGIVRHVIPDFKISDTAIDNDLEIVRSFGINVKLNCEVDNLKALREDGFDIIIVAVGAWKPGKVKLENGEALDALAFLEEFKKNTIHLGENVAVVGGGDTAIDVARAAKRVKGVKKVSIVYRRTLKEMPADPSSFKYAEEDKIEFCELLLPLSLKDGKLICERTISDPILKRVTSTGKTTDIPTDTVIAAIGSYNDGELLGRLGLTVDDRGDVVVNVDTMESQQPGVYVIGDAVRGAATVAEAIGDAIKCAEAITGEAFDKYAALNISPDKTSVEDKKGVLKYNCRHESERCLECATICECCVDVCPNRANISVEIGGGSQVIHLDALCNECGNCAVFCPYEGAPYKDKLTLFDNAEDFEDSENPGFFAVEKGFRLRLDGKTADYHDGKTLPAGLWDMMTLSS
ncbi:MAG: putative selenate reductase subunit YgfK [Defluviitaleaceae bacterium]|nr:putative selenate reductase subunit YgfK [Defluviitaleaceae bacterium]